MQDFADFVVFYCKFLPSFWLLSVVLDLARSRRLICYVFCARLDLSFISTVHSKQYHPYLTLSFMYFNKLCMVVFLNYLGFVTWPLNHQVEESLLLWISIINGQIGLNFRNLLVWVGSEFCQYQSELSSSSCGGMIPQKICWFYYSFWYLLC